MSDKVEIRYDGGIARNGQLHFYEYSRATYGFSRLLITAEHFRRSGRVTQKIQKRSYVELIITAPERGSFVVDVLVPIAEEVVPKLVGVSIKGLIAYIFHLISPRSKKTEEMVVELAKIRLAEMQEHTEQSRQETERIRLIEQIVATQAATTNEALDLLRYALRTTNRAVARVAPEKKILQDMKKELEIERNREKEIKVVQKHLAQVEPKTVARLVSRVRPMITEMGLPLRKSADYFTIGAANDDEPLAYFDAERVAAVESKTIEEEPTLLEGRIKSYDRDAAVGKVKSDDLPRVLTFIVPADRKTQLQPRILAGMEDGVDKVWCEVLRVLDKSDQPTSLILLDVHDEEPEPSND